MNFTRTGQWHETSECGRYVVSGSKVMGKFKFQAWRLQPKALLETCDDAQSAREACERDANG